jgi:hypothetical protein
VINSNRPTFEVVKGVVWVHWRPMRSIGCRARFPGTQLIDHPKAIHVLYIEMIEAVTLVVCFFSYVTGMQAIQLWLLSSRVSSLALRTLHFLSVASQALGIKLSGNPNSV